MFVPMHAYALCVYSAQRARRGFRYLGIRVVDVL